MTPLHRTIRSASFCVLVLAGGCGPADSSEGDVARRTGGGSEAEVHAVIERFAEAGLFSGVVRVNRGGRTLFERAYGNASEELGVPSDPALRYKLHSGTKPLLAVAAMRSVEQGLVGLDDSICVHLDPCPPSWSPVTLRHLLRHTSGIPDFTGELVAQWQGDLASTLSHLSDDLAAARRAAPPGEVWSYSNSGYVLAARILEVAHGQPIHAVMQEQVFRPAGMEGATLERAPEPDRSYDGALIETNAATGYNGAPDSLQAAYSKMYVIPGAGGVVASAEDVARFIGAVFDGDLLSPEARQEMLAVPDEEDAVPYALGWVQIEVDGARVYRHDGGNNGFIAYLERAEETGVSLVVLSNLGFTPVGEIVRELRPALAALIE